MYAIITNKETKECSVGEGTNVNFYKSVGMVEMEVEKAYNGIWYVKGYAPQKPAPTREEIDALRVAYRQENIDDKTIARARKQANGTWTEANEAEYLALDAEVTAYIEENYPYPEEKEEETEEKGTIL